MNFFSSLQNIGVQSSYAEFKNNKIKISNIAAFCIIVLVALPFVIISITYAPSLTFIPAVGIVAMMLVWVFNRMGAIYLARIISAVTPLLLTVLFIAYLTDKDDELPLVLVLIALAFSILPFLVFDVRENSYLIFSALFNFLIFIGLGTLSEFFV